MMQSIYTKNYVIFQYEAIGLYGIVFTDLQQHQILSLSIMNSCLYLYYVYAYLVSFAYLYNSLLHLTNVISFCNLVFYALLTCCAYPISSAHLVFYAYTQSHVSIHAQKLAISPLVCYPVSCVYLWSILCLYIYLVCYTYLASLATIYLHAASLSQAS